MRILSWNINGLPSLLRGNYLSKVEALKPDIICLQEICTGLTPSALGSYETVINNAKREKYSGTACLAEELPPKYWTGFFGEDDDEGRLITLDYGDFFW